MNPQIAELLTRWSVRIAIACYLGRVALDLGLLNRSGALSVSKISRWLWTIGCLFYVSHVICAFEFFHQWDHGRAFAHTAAQTESLIGIRSGVGLFFNYAFTGLWLADTSAWWLRDANKHYQTRAYFWTVQGVFAFMVFNATVVFGPRIWNLAAIFVSVAFTIIYLASRDVPK